MSFRLVDLIEDAAISEKLGLGSLPSAKDLIDCEQLDIGELLAVPREDLRIDRPVEILGNAVDLQAHGRTADINRPLSYEAMADDIAALMKYLGINKADVVGYSLGGGVALRTAIQHPDLVKKLVVVSAPCKHDGWYPEILAAMAQSGPKQAERMMQNPLYQTYEGIAPRPGDWPVLFTKLGELLKKDYDWSREVTAITSSTLLVFGDADGVRPEHAVQFFELLGGGKRDAGWDGSGMSTGSLSCPV